MKRLAEDVKATSLRHPLPHRGLPRPLPLPHCDGEAEGEGDSKPTLVIGEESLCRTRPYYFRRCKRVKPTNIESLPIELLSDILLLLPADYLHDRASLVCRRWYHIIRSDAFVNKQIQHSTYGLLISCRVEGVIRQIFITATQGRVEISMIRCESTTLQNGFNGLAVKRVFHEVNNQYPLRNSSIRIVNPATKLSLFTPPLPPYVNEDLCCIAFAPSSMKYKLVVPHLNIHGPKLFILTVGVDSSWRDIDVEHTPPCGRVALHSFALITEGFVHWPSTYGDYLATMDVETEIVSFGATTPGRRGYLGKHLLSTGRFLTMVVGYIDFLWEIWEMKSETGEWRKEVTDIELGGLLQEVVSTPGNEALGDLLHGKYTPRKPKEPMVPIGWVKYPDVLLFSFWNGSSTHILYNRETQEINSIEIPGRYMMRNPTFVHKNNLTSVA